MKTKIICLLFSSLSFFLSSCKENKVERIETLSNPYLFSTKGEIRINSDESLSLSPFDTSITGSIYYYGGDFTEEELASIHSLFDYSFSYYHALSDRHYSYSRYDEKGNKAEEINNVRTINESYGTGKKVKVDSFLYDLLKKSYEFSRNSEGKFNRFLGTLNDLYENKLSSLEEDGSLDSEYKKNSVLTVTTKRKFSSFSANEKNRISSLVSSLPRTKEERQGLLSFDDATSSVTFNKYKDTKNLEISLGGNAKGYATERFCRQRQKEYPNRSLVINSGSSSIKAIGQRPDKREWKIQYTNPCYKESIDLSRYNPYEVVISHNGAFNLSTSGYYEQYFYSYLPDGEGVYDPNSPFILNSHILNPSTGYSTRTFDQVSVFLNDTGLADRYTTALRNTSSIKEAEALFASLNKIYSVSDAGLRLCLKEKDGSPYFYKRSDYSPLQSNGLPCIKTAKGEYSGDFSDLDEAPQEYLSRYVSSFEEVYYLTGNRREKASMTEENGKQVISRLEELK